MDNSSVSVNFELLGVVLGVKIAKNDLICMFLVTACPVQPKDTSYLRIMRNIPNRTNNLVSVISLLETPPKLEKGSLFEVVFTPKKVNMVTYISFCSRPLLPRETPRPK